MTRSVADLATKQALDEFRKLLSHYELDQDFVRAVLIKVKTIEQPQIRMCLLDLVVEEHENEIELLHSQIQPYDLPSTKEFFQNLPSPSHKEIMLPVSLQINVDHALKRKKDVLAAEVGPEDAAVTSNKEILQEILTHHVFIDPVAEYMEDFLCSKSPTKILYENQDNPQIPSYVTIWIVRPHDLTRSLISPTITQEVCFLLQMLKWLHWLFHFT